MSKAPENAQRHLVWLRADLRITDNTALSAACSDRHAQVACVYTITPAQWQQHDVAGVRVDFELRHLRELKTALAALNIPLLILKVPDFSALPAALRQLVSAHDITAVFANRQYEVNEIARDNAVTDALTHTGVAFNLFHDQCVLPPGSVLTGDGRFYSVFTPFKRNWLARIDTTGLSLLPAPRARAACFSEGDPVPASVKGFASHVDADVAAQWWPAGEKATLQRLQSFCRQTLARYDETRNFPAQDGSSRLSPYLAIGALSPRQCLNAAFNFRAKNGNSNGIEQWISEIGWRDFYKHVMVGWPRVCRHQPFRLETASIPWRHDEADFQRWCEGRTGFPIVDAAMRQLQQTGWMHNRLRMIVAMFLTKDLFIDWRWGEKFFMQHLIDGDLSANNGGWQWSASTGNDAAPYFRIFNPLLQSQKFDPEGDFIRTYVPELANVHDRSIHAPGGSLFSTYPAPMTDRSGVKERVLQHFREIKGFAD
ncbi:MAG: deoxyribodipyrimidine photo-lyase [Moraxellaceae bacterium]|nr:deoxyribodipyrimidine photo-lyase [Moraxellaceae bacterium]